MTSSLQQIIEQRRSVRRFDSKPVEKDLILSCCEAARLAPSADNIQPWRFVILDDPDIKEAFGARAFSGIHRVSRWALNAPVLVALCADLDFITHRAARILQGIPYYLLDLGMAGEHFILRAQELGLGSCWIGWFNPRQGHKALDLPRGVRLCELIALGYPHPKWKSGKRRLKSMESMVFHNQWGNPLKHS